MGLPNHTSICHHLPTWFCHFADIWLVSGCGSGISCKASASTDLGVISINTFQQRVLEQDKSSFRRQEEKGLYRDEWARSVPSSETVESVCWQDEHWCRLPTAATRRQFDLRFRPFQPHTLYWQQKPLPLLRKKRLLGESPGRTTVDYILLREVVAEIKKLTYLQYVNHVTQQRLLVVSSADQVVIQCHQFKLMSVSENTTASTRIRTKKSQYQCYKNQYSTKSASICTRIISTSCTSSRTISTRTSSSYTGNRTITKLSMPILKIPVQILKVSVAVLYSKYQH